MVSGHLLLPAGILLSILAACAAVDLTTCVPGLSIPKPPVPSCRIYTVSRTCGLGGPYGPFEPSQVLKERCCQELAAVPSRCRCAALGFMMDGERGLQDFPVCTRETQRAFARRLTRPAECDLPTIDGGMCYSLASPRLGAASVSTY